MRERPVDFRFFVSSSEISDERTAPRINEEFLWLIINEAANEEARGRSVRPSRSTCVDRTGQSRHLARIAASATDIFSPGFEPVVQATKKMAKINRQVFIYSGAHARAEFWRNRHQLVV